MAASEKLFKNFVKPYHEELSSKAWSMWQHYITPKHLHLKALGSKLLLDICLADSRILYFWYVLKSIHRLIIELHALQCLFAMGPDKKQRRGRIISNFTKGETFHLLGQPSTLGGNLIMRSPFLHPSKKASLSPLVWPRREYIWTLRKAYLFILKIVSMFSIPSSRNRMMSTYLIANITPPPPPPSEFIG